MSQSVRLIALLLFASLAAAQTCAQQPGSALDNISEWACKSMSYEQAWDLLTSQGIAPVRNAKITQLGATANYYSKTQRIIRGLQIVGYGSLAAAGLFADKLPGWQIAALMGGPKLTEEGIKFFGGAPKLFEQTPNEAGFVTIYTMYTPTLIAGTAPKVGAQAEPQYYLKPNAADTINSWVVEVAVADPIPSQLQGLVSDMRRPQSEQEMRWIAEYYLSINNEAEAAAVLARGCR